jgi:hypothetical protein
MGALRDMGTNGCRNMPRADRFMELWRPSRPCAFNQRSDVFRKLHQNLCNQADVPWD